MREPSLGDGGSFCFDGEGEGLREDELEELSPPDVTLGNCKAAGSWDNENALLLL